MGVSEMEAIQLLTNIERDQDWLIANLDYLKKNFDQKFIAIKQEKVIAVGTLMEDVIKTLTVQNLDPSETLIYFISKVAIVL